MIEARGVAKSFGRLAVLRGATFTVEAGTAAALVGSNGSGKTTLMRCLLGVTEFDGEAAIAGVRVQASGKEARARVGYLPQNVVYPADWTARAAVRFIAKLRRADPRAAEALLGRTGLAGHEDRLVSVFSGGMRRRLGLALALVGDPPVLLMDEPTANLDAAGREDFLELVQTLKDGHRTVLFCSHREDEVAEVADRVLVLAKGVVEDRGRPRVLESGTAFLKPPQGKRAALLAALRRSGLDARAVEIGLALVEVDRGRFEALRGSEDEALAGTTMLELRPALRAREEARG